LANAAHPQETRSGLDRLRSADPGLRRFGAATHRYRLNPVLSEGEVLGFEKRLGVRLPKEYREFVTQAGDGGAGPGYGIYALGSVEEQLTAGRGKARKLAYDPGRPFARPSNLEEARRLGGFPSHGVLPLAEIGCGGVYVLVSSGPERGTVWAYENDEAYHLVYPADPVYPEGATVEDRVRINGAFGNALLGPENKVRLNFWQWYTRWMEEELRLANA
jgi:hypothetical protein